MTTTTNKPATPANNTRQKTEGRRYGFFGASGCGKTYLMKRLARRFKHIVIVDPKEEIEIRGYRKARDRMSFLRALSYQMNAAQPIRIIITGEQTAALADWFFGWAFYRARANILIIVDETQEICPTGTARNDPDNNLIKLARLGRSRGISLFIASQRINAVDINLRGNLNDYFLFRQGDFSDAQTVKKMIGKDLFTLPARHFYHRSETGDLKLYKSANDL